MRFCFSINTTAQHPTASGLSWKPWKPLHGSSSSQTSNNLSQWQVRENNPKCERLLPKPNRTRIASACHVCHDYRARTPRATEPDRLELASADASDIGMSRQSTCNKSPFPTKLAALQGYGSYRGHDQAGLECTPLGVLVACRTAPLGRPINAHGSTSPHFREPSSAVQFVLEDVMVWASFLENWFLQTTTFNLFEACELPRIESRSQIYQPDRPV